MLALTALVTAVLVRDLALPFPRPTPTQAVQQLAEAVQRQAADAEPDDMIDVYGGRSEWLSDFETEIAGHLGMERAMFFPTGVAAQNSALAVHAGLPFRAYRTQPPPVFVMHETSHLHRYEEAAYSELLGLGTILAGDADRVLAAADVQIHLERLAAVGVAPSAIVVELPHRELGCATVPLAELRALRALADKYRLPLHLDGARLWEIAPYYASAENGGVTLQELVGLFDTAYVSFYKGLGALTGAMLLGPEKFVSSAAPWRRRLGANPYTVFPYALSCRDAFRRHHHTFAERADKLVALAPLLAAAAEAEGGSWRTVPAVPQCCQAQVCLGLRASTEVGTGGDVNDANAPDGGESAIKRIAVMEAARDAVDRELGVRVFQRIAGPAPPHTTVGIANTAAVPHEVFFEWCLGPAHVDVEDEVFVQAWTAFWRELRKRS